MRRAQTMNYQLTHAQRWLLKHGAAQVTVEILAQARDVEELNRLERFWITQFTGLTNHLAGGLDKVAPAGKVTEAQVHEIRHLCDRFVPQEAVAARYGITVDSVSNIRCRRTWRHLPEAEPPLDVDAWMDALLVQ